MFNPHDYTVGWICAISTEYVAAQAFLDEIYEGPDHVSPNDNNDYTLGKIGKHNVVVAVLPDGEYGTSRAASVASDMLHSFPNIRIGLMVGIGGGAPSRKHDIRLGDIVVSAPRAGQSGVLQYDFGKTIQNGSFQRTGLLNQPPPVLRAAMNGLKAQYERDGHRIEEDINDILRKKPRLQAKYSRPDPSSDRLYKSGVVHTVHDDSSCVTFCGADLSNLIERPERTEYEDDPAIHYGVIASGNHLMKDASMRDKLVEDEDILCFEMEAAGLMNHFPCLIIRGICDYSDSHKNKLWQGYAAMAAAAYAKDLLCRIPPNRIEAEKKIGGIQSGLHDIRFTLQDQTQQQETRYQDDKDMQCLKDLHVTDPQMDKQRIQDTKGGLLRGCYRWVLNHADFRQFRDDPKSRMLWIKGDPGKGKTMLICGIIDELEEESLNLLSYFFCQATEFLLSDATSVLRGLIYHLLIRQQSLIRHVRVMYDIVGEKLFRGVNVWVSLVKILTDMLTDSILEDTILIVDALDECITGRLELLDFIIQSSSNSSFHVKWVVSSRNWPEIERQLGNAQKVILHLELNKDSVSDAVETYVEHRVGQLAHDKKYDEDTRNAVQKYLTSSADGTFLWVALVCQQLAKPEVARRHTLSRLKSFPQGLNSLYDRMIQRIYDSDDSDRCREVLSIALVIHRPITLEELKVFVESPEDLHQGDLEEIIASCGSFLTVREGVMYFVHQSAKDYLLNNASHQILPAGIAHQHRILFSRSLKALSGTLQRDIYSLSAPGFLIENVSPPNPDLLASIRYSCIYWVDHLKESDPSDGRAGNAIYDFVQRKYLNWLESLSLLHSMSAGVAAVQKLETIVRNTYAPQLLYLVRDARRFILSHKQAIEVAPLQAYASALVFSPTRSLVRKLFKKEEPDWITFKSIMDLDWKACLQTLEGHNDSVVSVVFSPDGQRLASGSRDGTIKVWDAGTGAFVQTLEDHDDSVVSVVFSPDSQCLASGSRDGTVKTWDAGTWACVQTLEGHDDSVVSVVFSPDCQRLASGSRDGTIKVWDVETGACVQSLKGHGAWVVSVAYSPDGHGLASGSGDSTIKIWDTATGACVQTLEGHGDWVVSVAYSPNGQRLASGSANSTIKIWFAATGACVKTLEGHGDSVVSVVYSPDGQWLASGSADGTIKVWDEATGVCVQTLEGHGDSVVSVVYSPDGQRLASGSSDRTIKIWDVETGASAKTLKSPGALVTSVVFSPDGQWLTSGLGDGIIKVWNGTTGVCVQTLKGHGATVSSVAASPGGQQLASGSRDHTIKIWDIAIGKCVQTLEGHEGWVVSVVYSPDGQRLASGSGDGAIKVWDATTGACVQTLKGHGAWVSSVVFSPGGQQLASGSGDSTIKVWDTETGACVQTLEGYGDSVSSVVFSPDGYWIASGSGDGTITTWDEATGKCVQTLEGHGAWVVSVVYSPGGERLASGSANGTIKIWDVTTGTCVHTIEGHGNWVRSLVFSPDGQRLASGSYDHTIKIWEAATGACVRTIEVGRTLAHLSFNPRTNSQLSTDIGFSELDPFSVMGNQLTKAALQNVSPSGFGMSSDGMWIVKDGSRLLWLPLEYRAVASAVVNTTIAIGCRSGRVLEMEFSGDMSG